MKHTKLSPKIIFLMLVSLFLMTFYACQKKADEARPKTTAEKIAKQCKVASAKIGGTNTNAYAAWLIGFTANADGSPSSYVAGGNVPLNPARFVSGRWLFENGETRIVLDKGTENESVFEVVSISETKLVIRWKVPANIDKTTPMIEIELVPVS